ncbi:Prefoldin [Pavlovales sp. CCMP2436]|nr:Prefoldin [Pavlovales sp. CCMP2436]|mmetsp:Transcript_13405/g.34164  ORF Transcript_13405/g.34164 Transcript_13405/m.34164 type:complete len:145 (-) Transcript_13405:398-832(-)
MEATRAGKLDPEDEEKHAQAILARLQQLQDERKSIVAKITELDGEHTEHNLVISTLEGLPGDRRCFRMIGDVLVERNNAEVLAAVIGNRDNLKKIMEEMANVLKNKELELLDHVKTNNIRRTSDLPAKAQQAQAPAPMSAGVLV